MAGLRAHAVAANRALALCLGAAVIVAALAAATAVAEPMAILAWSRQVLGGVFVSLYLALVFVAIYAWGRLAEARDADAAFWRGVGLHAGNGVATLALTFTLYGISAGIADLAEQELNPSTVNAIIADLTRHFSQAFMTTVVGLPTAAALRALLSLSYRGGEERCAS